MKLLSILFPVLLVLASSMQAQNIKTKADTKALADKAMQMVVNKDIKGSFELYRKFWPIPDSELDELINLTQSQLLEGPLSERFGAILSFEPVDVKNLGESLVRYTYILKMENTAMRWSIIFYKGKDNWMVNYVYWDDKIQLIFDEVQ